MIDKEFDYTDQFFRMATIALAKTLSKKIRWINKFTPLNDDETGFKRVTVPFYTSLTGDERFVLDAFVDDIADKRVTVNTDQYQRGQITFIGFNTLSDEFANPNQYIAKKQNVNKVLKNVISKVKAIPIVINYELEIQLATSNEIDKASQKILNLLFNYYYFNIDYYGIKIDANFNLPDDKQIEIPREITFDSDRKKTIKFSLEIRTYFPVFKIDIDDLIVCDNDDDFDWEYLNIPRPTLDYSQSFKNYNEHYGQLAYAGGSSGLTQEGETDIKRVYWENLYRDMNKYFTDPEKTERIDYNPTLWNKEDFEGVDPGLSSKETPTGDENDLD